VEKLQFIGDAINTKASLNIAVYVMDKSYGMIGDSQVGIRCSISYLDTDPPQSVRWSYYDIPENCNIALGRIFYFRPVDNAKDFKIETRIVNNKARIYSKRGK